MATDRPSDELLNATYERLRAGEPDAPADLISLVLDPLITEMRRSFSGLPDPDLVIDVVTDSLLKFVQHPERFDPEKRGLWGYLKMDIDGDLRNAWKAQQRRPHEEIALDDVEHDVADGNSDIEGAILRKLAPHGLPDHLDVETVLAKLREAIPDDRDWQVMMLIAQGERSTAAFAEVLAITEKPAAEQRAFVKRAKDRLYRRLQRLGEKLHEQ